MTINSEVIRMVKTSVCRASYHVLEDFKITSGNEVKRLADIFPLSYFWFKVICVKTSQLADFMPV